MSGFAPPFTRRPILRARLALVVALAILLVAAIAGWLLYAARGSW